MKTVLLSSTADRYCEEQRDVAIQLLIPFNYGVNNWIASLRSQ